MPTDFMPPLGEGQRHLNQYIGNNINNNCAILVEHRGLLTPLVEGWFRATFPALSKRVLEHPVTGICTDDAEPFLDQHHRIDPVTSHKLK